MMEATGRTEDHPAYWAARPTEIALDAETAVQVVGTRCVYVNDYRVAGGKPYYSEGLPNQRFKTTIRDVLDAFPDRILEAALREREAQREHTKAWREAAERLVK
jgi:hypothetical protein